MALEDVDVKTIGQDLDRVARELRRFIASDPSPMAKQMAQKMLKLVKRLKTLLVK